MNVEVRLRKLNMDDANYMLEWMHDSDIVRYMSTDFMKFSLDDCKKFIEESDNSISRFDYAIVFDNNEYLGTVSLKNICNKSAEFAIAVRKKAIGRNISSVAMKKIIDIGFSTMGLKIIYWYVDKKNIRAIKFYDKNGYKKMNNEIAKELNIKPIDKYLWYCEKNE